VAADRPVEIWQLVRDDDNEHDVLLLRDDDGRLLPIVIGPCEATAIWVRLSPELASPFLRRPWTHDLLIALLERMEASIERVVIDSITETTFFATLHLRYLGRELIVDARPSDAIALLLRMPAPLFVNEDVLAQAAFHPDEAAPHDDDENEADDDDSWQLPE
jgi:bifunctional DNase/RNase